MNSSDSSYFREIGVNGHGLGQVNKFNLRHGAQDNLMGGMMKLKTVYFFGQA